MPVSFLTPEQIKGFGRYDGDPSPEDLTRYFHLDDHDRILIAKRRERYNRLGFALQLTTVRYVGAFLDNPIDVPAVVMATLTRQLGYETIDDLEKYRDSRQRYEHVAEIRSHHGYSEFTDFPNGFRLGRWLYALCWTGTDRPSVLFDRATAWLLSNRVLLPGATVLERFIASLRQRVEKRLWHSLAHGLNLNQRSNQEQLLTVPQGGRRSLLDMLRTGPTKVSGPALVRAVKRLADVRALDIQVPVAAKIPPSRLNALARFANTSKVTAVAKLPRPRRLATLVAFAYTLEATAMDDALQVLEILLRDLFAKAMQDDQKARLRTLKDLDAAAMVLVGACTFLFDVKLPPSKVRKAIFDAIKEERLANAMQEVSSLVRPPDDVFYKTLQEKHRHVRWYIPTLLEHIKFIAGPAGKAVVEALNYCKRSINDAPRFFASVVREIQRSSAGMFQGRSAS